MSADPLNGGTLSINGETVTSAEIEAGAEFTVNAVPESGFIFLNWTEDGKVISTTAEFTLNANGPQNLVAHFAKTHISVSKVDIADGAELEGATLQILDSNGAVVDEWVSTKEAHEIEGLKTNEEYTLRETVAPDGYTVATDTTFTIDETGKVTSTGTVTADNVLLIEDTKTKVKVSKVDIASGRELEGATIQVIEKDSEGNEKVVEEWVSTKEAHEIEGLKTGEEYTLRETVAPEGYTVATDTTFSLDETGKVTTTGTITEDGILLVEDARTQVSISKVDIADGAELEDATIQIIDSDGNVVDEWTTMSGLQPHTIEGLKTNEEYILRETVAPDGYTVAADTTFTIDETGKVTSTGTVTEDGVLLVEDEKTRVSVSKVDIASGEELEGATIQILDSDGKVVDEWVSGKDVHTIEGLKTGVWYILREAAAPEGYAVAKDTTFTIYENSTITYTGTITLDGILLVEDVKAIAKPAFALKVRDVNDSDGESSDWHWQDSADYDVGDAVPFRIAAVFPDNAGDSPEDYAFTLQVKTEKGLRFDKIEAVKLNGKELAAGIFSYSSRDDGADLTFRWDKSAVTDELNGASLEILFTAELTDDAVLGKAGNPCRAAMSDVSSSGASDHVIVFTFALLIDKTDADGKALEGAAFRLEKMMADGTRKQVASNAGSGTRTVFSGIDDGVYVLTETAAPTGYDPVNPIEITVRADHIIACDADFDDPEWQNVLKSLTGITEDLTLAADSDLGTLSGEVRNTVSQYEITFVNWDETELQKGMVAYGQTPEYTGEEPTKPATAQYTYKFAGWEPEITTVTGKQTYKATYSKTVNEYEITWLNEDGTLIDTTTVEYGKIPAHDAPTKAATAEFTYTFAGWDPAPAAVTGPATYKATFTAARNTYTVTWVINGKAEKEIYEYGAMPTHADPTRPATAQYTYTFKGWTPAIEPVTGNATYTAVFDAAVNHYTVTWVIDGRAQTEDYAYGEMPWHVTPAKSGALDMMYVFKGWTPTVVPVTGNAVYTALFEAQRNPLFPGPKMPTGEKPPVPSGEPTPPPSVSVPEPPAFPFTDVALTDSFCEDVKYVYDEGIMNGISSSLFDPFGTLTRGMVVTILYRIEGSPDVEYKGTFTDVPDGVWYTDGVEWAAAHGIVNGYGNGKFGPTDEVTREQLAAILYRYAGFKGYDVSIDENTNFLSYNDVFDIAGYAKLPMYWAIENEMILDTDGYLRPAEAALRWEVAAAIRAFCEKVAK